MIKILLTTTRREMRRSFREYLLLEGYQVIEASTVEETLRQWKEEKPDMVILDAALPQEGSLTVLKTIRRQSVQALVVMLSETQNEEQEIEAFNAKVDDYIARPISIKVLMKRIQRRLEQRDEAAEIISLGSLTISHAAYQAWWNRNSIELTSKEFELLWTLASQKGRVLTRTQLLDGVWGYAYVGDERIVDAHIKNLRRKLPVNIIRTVKGRGYTLSPEACLAEPEK